MGTRYSTPPGTPVLHHPGYTPPHRTLHGPVYTTPRALYTGLNIAVGLKSVDQLTSGPYFSGSRGITEVYNLTKIGRIINHSFIPGNK